MEVEYNVTNLSHQNVLPVARGLIALILHNSANVDMFLLACKVKCTMFKNTINLLHYELLSGSYIVRFYLSSF